MATWKRVERDIARILGGERVPVTGRVRGSAPDVAHVELSIEVKHRERFPDWLMDAMDQALAARRQGQLPVVFLHEKGRQVLDSLVVLRLRDCIDEG